MGYDEMKEISHHIVQPKDKDNSLKYGTNGGGINQIQNPTLNPHNELRPTRDQIFPASIAVQKNVGTSS